MKRLLLMFLAVVLPLSSYAGRFDEKRVFTIAASNSTKADKKVSDYVCDGVTDASLITSVIDKLVANGIGGKIVFKQGRYFMNEITRNDACIDIALGESNALIELCSEITDKNYIGGATFLEMYGVWNMRGRI